MFYGKSPVGDDLYHTGQFSREIPPAPYLGDRSEAAAWDTKEGAEDWVNQFGGVVIESSDDETLRAEHAAARSAILQLLQAYRVPLAETAPFYELVRAVETLATDKEWNDVIETEAYLNGD